MELKEKSNEMTILNAFQLSSLSLVLQSCMSLDLPRKFLPLLTKRKLKNKNYIFSNGVDH